MSKVVKQAEINIGTAGHVDHGKTSLLKALTGEWADRHSEEIKRGITIRLGYVDASFYKCEKDGESFYTAKPCPKEYTSTLTRKVSFVDCPGHENLMAVMLSGAFLMDGTVLVIAANEPCPRPQTQEHLSALDIIGIKDVIIVQNKVDLVTKEEALKNYDDIKKFVNGTIAENAPIIPMASHYDLNMSAFIEAVEKNIQTPKRDKKKDLKMVIARSFDTNKPGIKINVLSGGVIGGSIVQGTLAEGEEIEIRPGVAIKEKYEPLITKAVSLSIKEGGLKEASPGGLVGVGTLLDPHLTKSDNLIGNVLGRPGKLPPTRNEISVETQLFERVLNTSKVDSLRQNENVVISSGTATTTGIVGESKRGLNNIILNRPLCVADGDKVAISRRVGGRWLLIGYGVVK